MPLFILFIVMPVLELITFIKVGGSIGILWTLFWIFFSAVVGISIIRVQGFTTLLRVRERMGAGELPAKELLQGFLLALAGVLLVIPGFISDALGLFLLLPWVSSALAGKLMRQSWFSMPQAQQHYQSEKEVSDVFIVEEYRIHQQQSGETIEGEYKRED